MPTYFGTDATLTHTINGVKVHRWRLRKSAPVYDNTGDADTNTVTVRGNRIVELTLECTVTSTTLPDEGDSFTASFDIDGNSSADLADSFVIQSVEWGVQKTSGGPPQTIVIHATANDQGASNQTATDGVFA